jgi:internalin A
VGRTIESVPLVDEKCTDADVRALATKYPGLQVLDIGWQGMTDSVLKEVAKVATIETLHVRNSSIYSRDGRVKRVALTADGWRALRELPKLRELAVNDTSIDEAAMKEIGQLRQLSTLYLAHNDITDAGVRHLAGMTQLTSLGLLQKGMTDESVPTVMKLQKLEVLLVDQTGFTDAAAKRFATLPRLAEIDVRAEKITPEGVKALAACRSLRRLTVLQRQVPAEVLGALREGNGKLFVGITDAGRYLEPLDGR